MKEKMKRITFIASADEYTKLQSVQEELGLRTYAESLRFLIANYLRRRSE